MSSRRRNVSRWAACLLVLVLLCFVREARADDDDGPPRGSPYRLRLPYDVAFLALGAGGSLTGAIGYAPVTCPAPCIPPHNQLGIDDTFNGQRSRAAMTISNVLLGVTLAAPVVLNAIDSRFHGWAEDMVVIVESLALSTAVTQVMKSASGRPAPLVYSPNASAADLNSPDAARAFPSGHTSASVAVATSYAVTFWKRHPESPWRIVVLVAAETLAAGTGILTIAAGWHYPTDVVAGGLIGGAFGVLMPFLHADW